MPSWRADELIGVLGWETILESRRTTSWSTTWRCGYEIGILVLPHYCFPWKNLKFYISKEENTIVMEHFNRILFYKSAPANKQHINQSINQSINVCTVCLCVSACFGLARSLYWLRRQSLHSEKHRADDARQLCVFLYVCGSSKRVVTMKVKPRKKN